jgi:hypothetical protein
MKLIQYNYLSLFQLKKILIDMIKKKNKKKKRKKEKEEEKVQTEIIPFNFLYKTKSEIKIINYKINHHI